MMWAEAQYPYYILSINGILALKSELSLSVLNYNTFFSHKVVFPNTKFIFFLKKPM